MFKIRPFIIFFFNLLFMAISWKFYTSSRGDEYLALFMIPLVFIAAPFVIDRRSIAVLFLVNLAFFCGYCALRILDVSSVVILTLLLVAVTAASSFVGYMFRSFMSHNEEEVLKKQRKYNSIVNELEDIDRRGRKIENELSLISRLYEVTKKMAPALKMEELIGVLFNFLEENFKFQAVHLLLFSDGEFSRAVSKGPGGENYKEGGEQPLDYGKIMDYAREKDLNAFFLDREEDPGFFASIRSRSGSIMVFPMLTGDKISAALAVEGAFRSNYVRFRILIPQIALKFRKVELYEQVQALSIIDGLTEVYLRRYLMYRLGEEVDRASRLKLTFAVAMVDVDHFKKCNDEHGHLVGDAVLRKIAGRLKHSVREVDMVARYGGEEFCVLLPETTKKLALTVAERLRRAIESKSIKAFDEELRLTVSVGIATYPEDGEDVGTLIEKADTALYKAKRKGRNAVCAM